MSAVSFSFGTVISSEVPGASSVYAADIDGDGDMDVLSTDAEDDKIAWYENTDGAGVFGQQNVISNDASGARSVHAADIDGDGDIDVVSVFWATNDIVWFENIDGSGSFSGKRIISNDASSPWDVYATDIDGDGDLDVLSASRNAIAWYENTDGKGIFSQEKLISRDVGFVQSVHAADIDGDGDVDVLAASAIGASCHCPRESGITWYENTDGKGAFGPRKIISKAVIVAESVYAADIDGDGDVDVLSASSRDGKIAWYENTGENGNFGEQRVIAAAVGNAKSVYAADIDGDGDIDVLTGVWKGDSNVAWYENTDGKGSFSEAQVISASELGVYSVYAVDVDGDGDTDVLSASGWTGRIVWYERFRAAPGDANHDRQFNVQDIALVLLEAKYLTEESASFKEGDWNGDGLFDQLDIVAALQTGNYLKGPYADPEIDAEFVSR